MCWGCDAALSKYALRGFGPLTLLGIELAIATGLLWIVLIIRCHRAGSYALAAPRGVYALLGLLEPGIAYAAFNFGLAATSAVAGSLLGGLEASCTFALAVVILREPLTRRGLITAVVSGAGAVLVGLSSATLQAGLGDALILAGVLAAAACSLISAKQPDTTDPVRMTAWQCTVGLGITLPLLAWQWAIGAEAVPVSVGWREWLAAAISGAVVVTVPFVLWNTVVTKVPATVSAMALNLLPLFGVIVAVVALGESVTALDLVGGALIVVGVAAFNRVGGAAHRKVAPRSARPLPVTPAVISPQMSAAGGPHLPPRGAHG
jgi:drug/metabolite transporter (DMT)-like permease